MAWGAQFRRHRLLYNTFWPWHARKVTKKAFKNEKRIERRVKENIEKNRQEAEAKAEAEAEVQRVAAEKELARKEAEWKEKMRKAEE